MAATLAAAVTTGFAVDAYTVASANASGARGFDSDAAVGGGDEGGAAGFAFNDEASTSESAAEAGSVSEEAATNVDFLAAVASAAVGVSDSFGSACHTRNLHRPL